MKGLPFNVLVTDKATASKHLNHPRRRPRWLISLASPETTAPRGFNNIPEARRLRLYFDDITRDHMWYVAPTLSDVAQILAFSDQLDSGQVLVHCAAGVSRSTAAAYAILTKRLGPGSEVEVLDHIFASRKRAAGEDIAYPNELMVRHADQIMKRGGTLVTALSRKLREVYGKRGDPR